MDMNDRSRLVRRTNGMVGIERPRSPIYFATICIAGLVRGLMSIGEGSAARERGGCLGTAPPPHPPECLARPRGARPANRPGTVSDCASVGILKIPGAGPAARSGSPPGKRAQVGCKGYIFRRIRILLLYPRIIEHRSAQPLHLVSCNAAARPDLNIGPGLRSAVPRV